MFVEKKHKRPKKKKRREKGVIVDINHKYNLATYTCYYKILSTQEGHFFFFF